MERMRRWHRAAARLAVLAAGVGAAGGIFSPSPAAADDGAWLWDSSSSYMRSAATTLGADSLWTASYYNPTPITGKGVGVALIDTGVTTVPGLNSGQVVNGPDLSFESQDPAKRYLDGNGHGTHLAGIIAGRPISGDANFTGIAPDAKLTSIKVGVRNGAVDVMQTIAAIDWVVAHRDDDPANPIRVINLAYGTDGTQDYKVDPLTHAVENAWRAGIVVVVAGGNDGPSAKLVNPAYDPFVVTVGALDTKNTWIDSSDDTIAGFSTIGTSGRHIDVVAPGRSIVSLRVPGSEIDTLYPGARIGTNFFRGSGSSQAAAMVSGAVALLKQKLPTATPDQIKKYLIATSFRVQSGSNPYFTGGVQVSSAVNGPKSYPGTWTQTATKSTGTGYLEKARGTSYLLDGTAKLTGEKDVFGATFDVKAWASASANKSAWSGGTWMGRALTDTGWVTSSQGVKSWSGRAWSGRAWSGRAWSGQNWSSVGWLNYGWE